MAVPGLASDEFSAFGEHTLPMDSSHLPTVSDSARDLLKREGSGIEPSVLLGVLGVPGCKVAPTRDGRVTNRYRPLSAQRI